MKAMKLVSLILNIANLWLCRDYVVSCRCYWIDFWQILLIEMFLFMILIKKHFLIVFTYRLIQSQSTRTNWNAHYYWRIFGPIVKGPEFPAFDLRLRLPGKIAIGFKNHPGLSIESLIKVEFYTNRILLYFWQSTLFVYVNFNHLLCVETKLLIRIFSALYSNWNNSFSQSNRLT